MAAQYRAKITNNLIDAALLATATVLSISLSNAHDHRCVMARYSQYSTPCSGSFLLSVPHPRAGYFSGQPKPEATRFVADTSTTTLTTRTLSHRSAEQACVAPSRVGRLHRTLFAAAAGVEDARGWGPPQVGFRILHVLCLDTRPCGTCNTQLQGGAFANVSLWGTCVLCLGKNRNILTESDDCGCLCVLACTCHAHNTNHTARTRQVLTRGATVRARYSDMNHARHCMLFCPLLRSNQCCHTHFTSH